jgi:hypothetical protein
MATGSWAKSGLIRARFSQTEDLGSKENDHCLNELSRVLSQ